jgi:hypothetical protein
VTVIRNAQEKSRVDLLAFPTEVDPFAQYGEFLI